MQPIKRKVSLRPATIADKALLEHWDTQQHVIDAAPNDAFDWEAELTYFPEWREYLLAEENGRPIGFIQIIDPELEDTHYWGDCLPNLRAIDIWIGEAEDLGRGYGTEMMQLALERCFAHPEVTAVLIDPLASNTDAIRFYERVGFKLVGPRQFGEDHCQVYQIERQAWLKKLKQ